MLSLFDPFLFSSRVIWGRCRSIRLYVRSADHGSQDSTDNNTKNNTSSGTSSGTDRHGGNVHGMHGNICIYIYISHVCISCSTARGVTVTGNRTRRLCRDEMGVALTLDRVDTTYYVILCCTVSYHTIIYESISYHVEFILVYYSIL